MITRFKDFSIILGENIACKDELINSLIVETTTGESVIYLTIDKSCPIFIDDLKFISNVNTVSNFLEYYSLKKVLTASAFKQIALRNNEVIIVKEGIKGKLYYKQLESLIKYTSINKKSLLLGISPFLFDEILPSCIERNHVVELLSLMFLSDLVEIESDRVKFQLLNNENEMISFTVKWLEDIQIFNNRIFSSSLKWIIEDLSEHSNLMTKKRIAQKQIVNLLSFAGDIHKINVEKDDMLRKLQVTYDIVISGKAEEFFRMQESMKKDFIESSKKVEEMKQRFNTRILTLFGISFSWFFVETINNQKTFMQILGDSQLLVFYTVLIIVLLTIILIMFFVSHNDLRKYIQNINQMNKQIYSFSVSEIKEESFIWYYTILILVIIILIITCFAI